MANLDALAARVAHVHGEHNPKLHDLQRAFEDLQRKLDEIRSLADDFVAPDWACRSYRELLEGLEGLDQSVRRAIG